MDQLGGQHRTGGADRMPMRDGAAFHIDDVLGQAERERHRSNWWMMDMWSSLAHIIGRTAGALYEWVGASRLSSFRPSEQE